MTKKAKTDRQSVDIENLQKAVLNALNKLMSIYEENLDTMIVNFIQNNAENLQFINNNKEIEEKIISSYIKVFGRTIIISNALVILNELTQVLGESYVFNNITDIVKIIINEIDKYVVSDKYITAFKMAILVYINSSQDEQSMINKIVGIETKENIDDEGIDLPF